MAQPERVTRRAPTHPPPTNPSPLLPSLARPARQVCRGGHIPKFLCRRKKRTPGKPHFSVKNASPLVLLGPPFPSLSDAQSTRGGGEGGRCGFLPSFSLRAVEVGELCCAQRTGLKRTHTHPFSSKKQRSYRPPICECILGARTRAPTPPFLLIIPLCIIFFFSVTMLVPYLTFASPVGFCLEIFSGDATGWSHQGTV